MRILVDMNLTSRWVEFLAVAHYETVHWSTLGRADTPDHDIFAYARDHDYVILTNDLDFPQILSHARAAKAERDLTARTTVDPGGPRWWPAGRDSGLRERVGIGSDPDHRLVG